MIDRVENLLIPQMPWPEVHPELIRVPKPTKNPAKIINKKELVILKDTFWSFIIKYIKGPIIRPKIKSKFELLFFFVVRPLAKIPLIPANLPVVKKYNTTALPIIRPPIRDEIGVKLDILFIL